MRLPMTRFVIAILVALPLFSCDQVRGLANTDTVDVSDIKLAPFSSMLTVDRVKYGLDPLPSSGRVKIERRFGSDARRTGYDVMLHIYDRTSKTIAFIRHGDGYEWIGEQDIHTGPHQFETPDGKINEQISVTFYKRSIAGEPEGFFIHYMGEDARLANKSTLALSDIEPLLHEWRETRRRPPTR